MEEEVEVSPWLRVFITPVLTFRSNILKDGDAKEVGRKFFKN